MDYKKGRTRKFTSVLKHELSHIVLNEKYGLIKVILLPKWKIEGICEYVSEDSSFDIANGLKLFIEDKKENSASYKHFTYRLMVDYLINLKELSIDEVLKSKYNPKQLKKQIRVDPQSGSYVPFK